MSDQRVDELAAGLKILEKRHGHFIMGGSFADIVALIGQVQLALRHPANRGYSSGVARRMIDDMITTLGASEPRVAELLRLGDSPENDVPRAEMAPGGGRCPMCGK